MNDMLENKESREDKTTQRNYIGSPSNLRVVHPLHTPWRISLCQNLCYKQASPLLFECCLYVGNVQITRISCWCELTLSCVVLGSLWYVTGWRFCFVFHCYVLFYELCCWSIWIKIFINVAYVEAIVPKLLIMNLFSIAMLIELWGNCFNK